MKIKDVLALMPLIGLCMVFGLVVWLLMSPPAGSTDARVDNLLALFSTLVTGKAVTSIAGTEQSEQSEQSEQVDE